MSEEQLPATPDVLTARERVTIAVNQMLERGSKGMCSVEELATWSGYAVDSQNLSFFVSRLRELLCEHGYYLSGEGQEGKAFFIVTNSENAVVAAHRRGAALKQLRNMETLLVKTDRTGMTEAELNRHERQLRKLRYTNRMLERREDVITVVRKHKPSIFKDDIEV